jgi:hypothetical protein
MKRFGSALLVMIAIGVLAVDAGPVAALTSAAAGSAAETSVPSNAIGIRAVGVPRAAHGFAMSLAPGGSATRTVVLTNRSADLRLTVRLEPVDASALGAAAPRVATRASAPNPDPASWLTLSDVVETLEPRANATVSIKVLVPANAIPGDSVAGLRVRVDRALRVSDSSAVPGNPSVSLPITVGVKGAATAQVSITSVRAVEVQGKDYLEIHFQNVGATPMVMRGRAIVRGEHPHTYALHARVAPLASTVVRFPWVKASVSAGAAVVVSTDDARGDQATWNGTVGATTPSTAPNTPSAPAQVSTVATAPAASIIGLSPSLFFLLVAVALAVLWLAYEVLRARARGRARRRLLAGAAAAAAPVAARVATPNLPVTVVASDEQMRAVVSQLAALVEAIDRLAGRLDGVPVASSPPLLPTRVPAAVVVPVAVPAPPAPVVTVEPSPMPVAAAVEGAPTDAAEAVDDDVAAGESYPYDWPTEAELDRFVERRRAAGTDIH